MIAIGYKNGKEVLRLDKAEITQADADLYADSIDSLETEKGEALRPTPPPKIDAPVDHDKEVAAKLEGARAGTQAQRTAALVDSVAALRDVLKAKGIL